VSIPLGTVNRITPGLPADLMQTYEIKAPKSTHWRTATCAEVDCEAAERGWKMVLDLTTDLGQRQARYIKHHSGRRFEIADQRDGLVTLIFRGGQECFQEHRVRTDRPEIYQVRPGDFRGNPSGRPVRVHTKPEHWIEDFQENTARLTQLAERG
jgi:hypothetical protein